MARPARFTPKQRQIYDFIRSHVAQHGFPPKLDEIRRHLGLAAVSTVHEHLANMESKGLLKRRHHKARGTDLRADPVAPAVELPVWKSRERVSVPANLLGRGRHFAVRARGRSMCDGEIREGDVLVARRVEDASDGELVFATVLDRMLVVRRLFRERERVRLDASRASLQPLRVQESDVRVHGVVVALLRRYATVVAIAVGVLAAGCAQPGFRPGIVLHEAHTQAQQASADTLVTYVTDQAVRVSHAAGDAIIDLESNRIILLDATSRTYRGEDLTTWEQRIREAREAVRSPDASQAPPTFQRTGNPVDIAGYACARYLMFTTRNLLGTRETVEQQIWVTTELELTAAAFGAYQRALAAMQDVGLPGQAAYPEGIVLRRETRTRRANAPAREADAVESSSVFQVETKELPAELFQVPADYRRADPPPGG